MTTRDAAAPQVHTSGIVDQSVPTASGTDMTHAQGGVETSSDHHAGTTASNKTPHFPLSDKHNPLGVHTTPEGGVAIAGRAGLPEGHAKLSDKVIGGIDKAIATVTFDKAGVQDAKLRMAGGLAAAKGEARAPVDHI